MAEDGVTTSGYGAEYAWQIRAVGYSPVGDEVIPPNAKNTSLLCTVNYCTLHFVVNENNIELLLAQLSY